MKIKVGVLIVMVIAMVLSVGCSKEEVVSVGLTQIVEHPSLDEIRQGILDGLADNGFKDQDNISIDFKNAGGALDTANLIANGFKDKDYIVAITTPSAQAAFNALKDKPIIYSGVTAPEEAGLVGDNITGVSDRTPIKKQMELLKALIPTAKKVGMIYNSSETNSQVQVDVAKEVATEMGLELVVKAVTTTNDIHLALNAIIDDIDVLYTHVDNTVASAYPIIVNTADEKKVPIIGAVEDYVKQGAIAVDGINNYKIGYQTGEMLVRVLKGEDIKEIPYETIKETELIINQSKLDQLGIKLSEELNSKVTKRVD